MKTNLAENRNVGDEVVGGALCTGGTGRRSATFQGGNRAILELVYPGHDPQTPMELWEKIQTLVLMLKIYQGHPLAWSWGQAWPMEVRNPWWWLTVCYERCLHTTMEPSPPGHLHENGKPWSDAAWFWGGLRDLARVECELQSSVGRHRKVSLNE